MTLSTREKVNEIALRIGNLSNNTEQELSSEMRIESARDNRQKDSKLYRELRAVASEKGMKWILFLNKNSIGIFV